MGPILRTHRRLATAVVSIGCFAMSASAQQRAISVCEALTHIERLKNELVVIRGQDVVTYHGRLLKPWRCKLPVAWKGQTMLAVGVDNNDPVSWDAYLKALTSLAAATKRGHRGVMVSAIEGRLVKIPERHPSQPQFCLVVKTQVATEFSDDP